MKKLVKLTLLIFAVSLLSGSLMAGEWHTDYNKAVAESEATGNPIFMLFTGSDWCGWCIKLEKEILSKEAFLNYAKKDLVLLKLDFPRKKELSAEEKAKNKELANKYGIKGFPTIVLLKKGKAVGQIGYMKYSPEKYVEYVKANLNK